MKNPVEHLLRLAGTTQSDFRRIWGFSRDGVVQALNGSYTTLPDRMVFALEQEISDAGLKIDDCLSIEYPGAENVDEAYLMWQHAVRVEHAEQLVANGGTFRHSRAHSPAHYFMSESFGSRDRFAKAMCLPRATLMRWERGITKGMPLAVKDALTEVKYPYVGDLDEQQRGWVAKFT
jgi:hypothetical protein